MIAEIYGKISATGSNLSDRLEDQLTGDFFGGLRYLPFDSGIKPILQKSVYPAKLLDCLTDVHLSDWHGNILFWRDCAYKRTEPDVVMLFDDIAILIEVKLHSRLSSDDDKSDQQEEMEFESRNQLGRESRLLVEKYAGYRKKVLLLLAPENTAADSFRDIKKRAEKGERIIADGVDIGYITWQKALIALKDICADNPLQKVVVQDLVNLLAHKGFERFNGFNVDEGINPKDYWKLGNAITPKICFEYVKRIRKDLYYEFK